jgi:TonB family protein
MRDRKNADLQRALRDLRAREADTRRKLLSDGLNLSADLQSFRLSNDVRKINPLPAARLKLTRHVAAAVLAIGMPALAGCQYGVSEMAPPPLKDTKKGADQDRSCSLVGKVTDPSGAVVANATITVINIETGLTRTVKTNEVGEYVAGGLHVGTYTIKAQATGFSVTEKTGIVLQPGGNEHADVALQIRADITLQVAATVNDGGCCEYAATPLKVDTEDLATKKKPFTYTVGEVEDHATFKGIAEVVYGDPSMWVQIFEANRDLLNNPGQQLPWGRSITIPPRKREVPKLLAKVLPPYPPEARSAHVSGDVVMDVTLKTDGTVEQVDLIDGPAQLVEAATGAVKQWRYRPLVVKGKPVLKFVVVVSFSKRGRVQ